MTLDGVTRVPVRLYSGNVHDVAIRERGQGLLAATDKGLQFLTDRAKGWQSITQGDKAFSVLEESGKLAKSPVNTRGHRKSRK
ncbi:MAG: hypothetical protein HQL21_06855, partial [Candidatus Omnitrophica bacterium]|nr:hypothetical protein [Candidatus Omnitrophota bacterium]